MESYLRSSSPPESLLAQVSKKKAAGVNNPSSLVDISKSSHKSNKRSPSIAQIQTGASTFSVETSVSAVVNFVHRNGTVAHTFSALSTLCMLTRLFAIRFMVSKLLSLHGVLCYFRPGLRLGPRREVPTWGGSF